MARPLRVELAGGLYHVTSRGNRREIIYDNHYHIMIETAEGKLSKELSVNGKRNTHKEYLPPNWQD